ncbi:MAG: tetratricopeptide repeat protein, partial [Paraburkholderia tropica]
RCSDALIVFEQALKHFNEVELLHYNRAVLLEHASRLEEAARGDDAAFNRACVLDQLGDHDGAAQAYVQCLQINPSHGEALRQLNMLMDKLRGDSRALIRHMSAGRRSTV